MRLPTLTASLPTAVSVTKPLIAALSAWGLVTTSICLLAAPAAHAEESSPAKIQNSNLSAEQFYLITIAEISASSGDLGTAYSLMLGIARKSTDAKLFERAMSMAIQMRRIDYALDAIHAWQSSLPQDATPNRYEIQLLSATDKLADTLPPLQRLLQGKQGDERLETIHAIPTLYSRNKNNTQALRVVTQALAQDLPSRQYGAAAWSTLGMMQLETPATQDDAWTSLQRAHAINPQATEMVLLALNLISKDAARANTYLQAYMRGTPQDDLQLAYIRQLATNGAAQRALDEIRYMTGSKPAVADAWLLQGTLELQNRLTEQAQHSLLHYLQMTAPQADSASNGYTNERARSQALLMLGEIAQNRKDYQSALQYLDQINTPEDALTTGVRKASIQADQGQLQLARETIRAIPELEEDTGRKKITLEAQLLTDKNQFEEAFSLLQQASQRYKDDTEILYDLSMMAERLRRFDAMEQNLRRIIALDPQHANAYNALGYSLADRKQRLGEARTLVQKALELKPDDAFIMDSMGWVEFRSGNLSNAQSWLEKAFALRSDTEIAAHLGEVLWMQGKHQQAKELWSKAQQDAPQHPVLQETMRRLMQ